jgi:hypothetical protein
MHQREDVNKIERGGENRIEEISWKKNFPKLYEVPKNTDFDFTHQGVVTAHILLLHQTQLAQLFKMMLRHTWTAKPQAPLNFTNTHRATILQQKPVDIPILPAKNIIKINLASGLHRIRHSPL